MPARQDLAPHAESRVELLFPRLLPRQRTLQLCAVSSVHSSKYAQMQISPIFGSFVLFLIFFLDLFDKIYNPTSHLP